MNHTMPRLLRRVLGAIFLGTLVFSSITPLSAATNESEPTRKTFSIPAGDAAATLKQFTEQSGEQVVYLVNDVRGVTTKPVAGDFTPREALSRMIAGTDLVVVQDEQTGALTVNRLAPGEPKNGASRLADAQAADRLRSEQAAQEAERVRIKDGVVQFDDYTVTGSRIRGVLGEATVQPVFSYTRADLDRFGVQTFADLRRYIPQLPQTDWNTQLETAFMGSPETGSGAQGLTDFGAGLRNLGGTATLVLLDGRRLPKMGQRFATTAAYDLSGIPLSAVERIEVLTDGASAVYGADALAGVINIILKREYRGSELSASYTNTFSTDTAERQIQLSHGFRQRGFTLMFSGTWSETNSLSPRDRWWSATNDKRPWGGTDGRAPIPGAQGGVRSIDGSDLPGLNSPQAAIPVGSDGQGLTIADYQSTPLPGPLDLANYTDFGSRTSEALRLSVSQLPVACN